MKFLKNSIFIKQFKKIGIDKKDLKEVLNNIFDSRSESLGSNLYKIRLSRKGEGKRGGFRSIFFWKKKELLIFCYLFPKNVKDNISKKEMKELKYLSDVYAKLSDKEIQMRVSSHAFEEVDYEE